MTLYCIIKPCYAQPHYLRGEAMAQEMWLQDRSPLDINISGGIMRAVVQRVSKASVTVAGERISAIQRGLMVLVGSEREDEDADLHYIARKLIQLRIFNDEEGKLNRSVVDIGGAILLVSQFTLMADTRKGRRPSYIRAMRPEEAASMIASLASLIAARGVSVQTGVFGAHMMVDLVNDGPVTIIIDSRRKLL